jgi:hypothetical protein
MVCAFALPLRVRFHDSICRRAMTSVNNSVILVLAVILFESGTTTLCSGESIQPGKVYKSPKHIFTIVAPQAYWFRRSCLERVRCPRLLYQSE